MIVMSLKFGGYKVTEKDIGTMIEKKLESAEDKIPVFAPASSAVKNEQKNILPSAHQTRTSDKSSATQHKTWNERMTGNSNGGRSKYANQSKQHKIFPKTAGADVSHKSHVLQAKSVQPKPFATKTPRSKGAAPTDDKSVPLQTKAVQPRQPKQPAAKKTSAQRQQPAQNLVETKMAIKQISQPSRNTKSKQPKPSIKAYFLGGLNEIGKNITVFECENDMVVVDCGMAFPDDDMMGVDLVIPDFTFIEKNVDKIRGIVITHGHEDHIGAMPYLLKKVKLPIYSTALTLGLIDGKLKEHGLQGKVQLNTVKPGQTVRLGCFGVEFIHVNHSISDAVGLAIHSPAGTVLHTGDFKIDCTPLKEEMIDLGRIAELGQQGVLALMADSTNVDRPGYTPTERKISDAFEKLFLQAADQRIIIATFASNISRVQQIINCAAKHGRKVALSGRSMINVMGIASELGYLDIPEGLLIDIDLLNRYPKDKVVLITTGSQGEPMSALTRMAFADHRKVEVGPGDCIIISAKPIPGNEKMVSTVIDELLKRGCDVVYESSHEIHVSGHASQEELKIIHGIVKPQYFIPVHGEQKHLRKHAELARSMGMNSENIFIGTIGDAVELNQNYMKQLPSVPAGRILVDGLGVGDVGSIVLRDRKHLAEDGLIVVVCTISQDDGHVVAGPDVVSRGFVYVRESERLMVESRDLVTRVLEECAGNQIHDWGTLKTRIKDDLSKLLYEKTRRNPMILPIIMEI